MFEERINELKQLNEVKKKQETEKLKAIADIEREIREYSFLKESDVRNKVNEIYRVTTEVMDRLSETCNLLYPGNNFNPFVSLRFSINDNKEDFISEIKLAYFNFKEIAQNIKSYELKKIQPAMKSLGANYAVISDIHKNISRYLQDYVQEKAVKNKIRRELQSKKKELQKDMEDWRRKVELDFNRKLSLLELDICFYKNSNHVYERGGFPEAPVYSDNYLEANLSLGLINKEKQEIIKFDAFGKSVVLPKEYDIYSIDLRSAKHTYITYKSKYSNDIRLWNIIKCLALRFIMCYPGKSKRLVSLYNSTLSGDMGNVMSTVSKCCKGDSLFLSELKPVATSYEDMRKAIGRIANEIDSRKTILNRGGYSDIFQYNQKNTDNILPLILCIIKDLNLKSGFAREIGDIAYGCNGTGINLIILNNEDQYLENLALLGEMNELSPESFSEPLYFDEDTGALISSDIKIDCTRNMDLLTDSYFEKMREQTEKDTNAIDFSQFHEEQETWLSKQKENIQKKLIIPVGKHGADTVSVELDSETPYAHAIIEGMNGTGKTSLLHSFILSAAFHYSPAELEIWIFDFMRGGVDFAAYSSLKHVKYMAIDCDKTSALEMLEHIDSQMSARGVIKGTNHPRTLIVIDEYSVMSGDCVKKLEALSRQIRKYGASLVLCSQDAPFPEITAQISHRFEMYKADRYALIPDANQNGDLTPENRLSIYQGQANKRYVLRFAYAGNSSAIENLIAKINKRYNSYAPADPVIMGKSRDINFADRKIFKNKTNNEVRVYLGEKVLTAQPIEYKINKNNRKLYLFGDRKRASYIERLIADAFDSLSPNEQNVFYLNLANYTENAMDGYREKHVDCVTQAPIDIGVILSKLYRIYEERYDKAFLYGEEIQTPIEVIVHCAGRLEKVLAQIENSRIRKSAVNQQECDIDRSKLSEDELLNNLINGTGSEVRNNSYEAILSAGEILGKLLNAEEECKINFVLHFDSIDELSNNSRSALYEDPFRIKDFIIIPTVPELNDEISFAEIIYTLGQLGLREYSETYEEKDSNCKTENDKNRMRDSFKQLILVDERKPTVYIPYEEH